MALSVQECIIKLKEKQPNLYPVWYIEDKGVYVFNLLKRGVNKEEAIANFYAVDPKKGTIAGPIPVMSIYGNKDLASKLDHPHMCSPEDQKPLIHNLPVENNDFILHYGIKGQRWGVRRFQDEEGRLTQAGKERYGVGDSKKEGEAPKEKPPKKSLIQKHRDKQAKLADNILAEFVSTTDDDPVDREKSKKGGLDAQRLATEALYTVINPLNALNFVADGVGAAAGKIKTDKYFKNREEKSDLDPETGLYIKKEGSYNEKQDLAAVNPGFMNMNTNTKNNCMLCTTTYDLRKRGYDVTAQLDSEGYTWSDLKKWYPKAKIEKNDRYDENGMALSQKEYVKKTMKNLLKQGDGARGNLMLFFKYGGGHSIIFEVNDGQVVFKDGQTGIVYKKGKINISGNNASPEQLLGQTIVNSFARLDNVDPNLKQIIKDCVR